MSFDPEFIQAVLESVELPFTGRTARDAEARFFDSGRQVTKTRIAVQIGKDQAHWFNVEAWGEAAAQLADVPKGKVIRVTGKVGINRYTKRDGTEASDWVIKARTIEDVYGDAFGGGDGGRDNGGSSRGRRQAPARGGSNTWQAQQEDFGDDADIPF